MTKRKWATQEIRNKIVELYLEGLTAQEAAARYGYTAGVCLNALKRWGIPARRRKYAIDETFFDVIDTEEKAYWLGFISADGYNQNVRIKIELHKRDRFHLKKLAKAFRSEHPIKPVKTRPRYCYIILGSKKLSTALTKLGVMRRKSLILQPCSVVPSNLLRHYWRGFFDGDGYLYPGKRRITNQWHIGFTGSQDIVPAFATFVTEQTGCVGHLHKIRKHSCVVYGGNTSARKIMKLLYENEAVSLARKKKLADKILRTEALHRDHSKVTAKELLDLYDIFESWQSVASVLKTSRSQVTWLRQKRGIYPHSLCFPLENTLFNTCPSTQSVLLFRTE